MRRTHPDLAVWAPHARDSVDLVLGEIRVPMARDGHWWHAAVDAAPGDRYAFCLDGGPERPDPRSLSQPDGPHARSALVDLAAHDWQDSSWPGQPLRGASIYELHIGTFTADGTFDAAIGKLDHLVALGISLVEVMPVAAFPGERGWGYDGVAPYAVHEVYGGAAACQRFVDACHQRGLGVLLDVVYNHLGPSGNYLAEFGPYFTDHYATPWGSAVNLDGAGSDEVRAYLVDNALMWLRDFHFDGLRLDAVHELHDGRAEHVLEELARRTDELAASLDRPLTLIAESDRNDPRTVLPRDDTGSGLGLSGQWADDIHHALHVALTGETQGYYSDFADPAALEKVLRTPFFHDGTWSSFRGRHHGRPVDLDRTPPWRFVASVQTHDQVGNRATGDRLSQLVSPGRLAAAAALLLTSPYTPMLFMGEEWGASTPWQYFTDHQEPELAHAVSEGRAREFAAHGWATNVPDPQAVSTFESSTLDWAEVAMGVHAELLEWYAALLRLRRDVPALSAVDAPEVRRNGATIRVHRGDHVVLINLGSYDAAMPGDVVLAFGAVDGGGTEQVTVGPDSVAILRQRR
ncbi:malto-oligosyltrehalose trehalohydrolase [Flexivirga endophytica]|uniref:Malto-oligosyltrehalose trehalohydrolase n=1 Tax=Flexivirga endophytica TaxID=1849103 RepID=A0A916TFK6_9MICO|nr:malto-oligosyltrehalose trehalohydrolase [Flexivirga endophytica]GGB43189.1 malto-oligosyltrehalose trehalohydrolase [Flexivirga endophytica]GHB64641.1 malto-oligosyltrehalose trehalohydrolase [Flexivirga endophytica]